MCDVPSIREELDRKTVEAIAEMTLSFDKGSLTQEAYYHSLHAINLVTNGLIDEEVSLVLSDNLKENVPHFIERRIFRVDATLIILLRELAEDAFSMIKVVPGDIKRTDKSFADRDDSVKACSKAFDALASQLIQKGFKEIDL